MSGSGSKAEISREKPYADDGKIEGKSASLSKDQESRKNDTKTEKRSENRNADQGDQKEKKNDRKDTTERDSKHHNGKSDKEKKSKKDHREKSSERRKSDRKSSRYRSKSRERRVSSRRKSRSKERRKSRSKSREHDRDRRRKDKDKHDERQSSRKDEDKHRERKVRSEGDKEKDKERDKEREKFREREKNREKDRDGEKKWKRALKREHSKSRSRSSSLRRRKTKSARREDSRSKSRSKSREKNHSRKKEDQLKKMEESKPKPPEKKEQPTITLEMVMRANPGISLPEAFQKLTTLRSAQAAGQPIEEILGTAAMAAIAGGTSCSTASGAPLAGPNATATRPIREVHVGNLPPGVTAPMLHEQMGNSLMALGLTTSPGNPIVHLRFGSEGHFAFAEFRTVEEAVHALKVGSLKLIQSTVSFSRPKGHSEQQMVIAADIAGVDMAELFARPLPTPPPASLLSPPQLSSMLPSVLTSKPFNQFTPVEAAAAAASLVNAKLGVGSIGYGLDPAAAAATAASLTTSRLLEINCLPDSNVIMVMNIPKALNSEQVKELLVAFGDFDRFNLLIDANGMSKGTAVCDFKDRNSASVAMKGLDNLPIGGSKLMVQRIPQGVAETLLRKLDVVLPIEVEPFGAAVVNEEPKKAEKRPVNASSNIVCLNGMVTVNDLKDDAEYKDILSDVKEECSQFGTVRNVVIPRPNENGQTEVPGLGDIFIEFESKDGAATCIKGLEGRTFGGNVVKARYYPRHHFEAKSFGLSAEKVNEELEGEAAAEFGKIEICEGGSGGSLVAAGDV
eukprot:CAMPEP_0171461418 /NCGR_PEP_ID=MMETSP0945-20130129/5875_1 /TAXON_ID=109269 /ORGANISM="Vaucheria litorea, Strain CCMP2940" /LENGTH=793 /DNA_ID=CAMNT_0011987763 /DNA_START=19 /DNA_END=2396 /DNA_ORIENTATION=+